MIKKRYKILGGSFKQYTFLSANTFTEGKNNIITDKNIDELINSFNNRTVDIFFYKGHKADQSLEREPLGKILAVYKSDDGIGLDAELELNEAGEEIIKKQGYYPSIEMVGLKTNEDDDNVYWSNCELKAVAAVEYPASKSVELLCASGIIENTEEGKIVQEGGQNMGDKLKELLAKIRTGDAEAKKELLDLIASDEDVGNAVLTVLTKEVEPEDVISTEDNQDTSKDTTTSTTTTTNDDGSTKEVETVKEEEKKEDVSLSAITWGKWCDEYAENNEGIRCSSKSESDTFVKAKKLFKAGFGKDEIMEMVSSGLKVIGVSSKVEEVKLSGTKDNKPDFRAISEMFKEQD